MPVTNCKDVKKDSEWRIHHLSFFSYIHMLKKIRPNDWPGEKNCRNVKVVIRQIDYPARVFSIRPNDIGLKGIKKGLKEN